MAFVDALFPNPRLLHGIEKTWSRPGTITGNTVIESRIQKLKHFRAGWNWPARLVPVERRDELYNFIMNTMQFTQYSVKFQDPTGSKWNNTQLQYAGSGTLFKLTTKGFDNHPIFHYGSDVTVTLNGSAATFTKIIGTDGVPCIAVTGATSSDVVRITGTFYYAVRLDQSTLSYSMESLNFDNTDFGGNMGDIALLEVFEY